MGANAQTVTSNGAANGICNQLLPNDSIYKRFLYVVSALAANGFYVIVDNHITYDSTYQNPAQWAALWAQVRPRPAHSSAGLCTMLVHFTRMLLSNQQVQLYLIKCIRICCNALDDLLCLYCSLASCLLAIAVMVCRRVRPIRLQQ